MPDPDSTERKPPAGRLRAIDATRGTAMVFVFLSHFADAYAVADPRGKEVRALLRTAGLMATPTFIVISGISLGYLYRAKRKDFQRIAATLFDRGLFFILIGHLLISLSYSNRGDSFAHCLKVVYITDVVGVCIMIGPWLVQRLAPSFRLALGFLTYFSCWVTVYLWKPSGKVALAVKEALVGEIPDYTVLWYSFPILTWIGPYLCCTVIGEHICRLSRETNHNALQWFLSKASLAALLFSSSVVVGKRVASYCGVTVPGPSDLLALFQKSPPGPIYFLFFGGLGLAILLSFLRYGEVPFVRRYTPVVEMLGRVSFFAFLLQYFLFEYFLYALHLGHTLLWPLYLALCVASMLFASQALHQRGMNRFLSFSAIYFLLLRRPGVRTDEGS